MNTFILFIVYTVNSLGIFNDPFEFEGDYGANTQEIRQKVFEQVLVEKDLVVEEVITPELLEELEKKQPLLEQVGFKKEDLDAILEFTRSHKKEKILPLIQEPGLLHLDKKLHAFDLPILGSTREFEGEDKETLKEHLLDTVFTREVFLCTKPQVVNKEDIQALTTPAGQVFSYWMYQALHLQAIGDKPLLIGEVNQVKEHFAKTIGNPEMRAKWWREHLVAADAEVVFVQESDTYLIEALTEDGYFLSVEKQNLQDGTLVFLRSDIWETEYVVVPITGYSRSVEGRLNVVLATKKETGEQFLLASGHGHSTKAEDGRLQVALVVEKFYELFDGKLQLLIGIDANTKTEEDVQLFREQLDRLGLIATNSGPTTIKKRMITVQHGKAGKTAIHEEDYLITLKDGYGFDHVTVGFTEDRQAFLPNQNNLSDHYPVGAYYSSSCRE